jgi:hypothetical protein
MRVVRGLVVALLTAFAGCIFAVFLGDYLTKLAHVPEMQGPTQHGCIFSVRASRNSGGFSDRSHCLHPGSAAGISLHWLGRF